MQTIKLPYKSDNSTLILEYQRQYSTCLHFMYNRVVDKFSQTEIKHLNINNTELLDSWFKQSCVYEALQINSCNKNTKVIFGGKRNFFDRLNDKISKDEYKQKRISAIYSIGEKSNPCVKGNRKFSISQDLSHITFKPNRKIKIDLELPNLRPNYLKIFKQLYLRQQQADLSITYKLDQKYIYISFDESILSKEPYIHIANRTLGLDLNPNYIGWSIVDWLSESEFKVVDSGVYSFKNINDKEFNLKQLKLNSPDPKRIHINNKRKYETYQIAKDIIDKCLHYRVEIIGYEDLSIKSKDHDKGKRFNKSMNNQWIRNDFISNLVKRANIFKINIREIRPEYSSFIGNFLFRYLKLPDMILSSIEIGRRAYEFNLQYVKKIKDKKKNIISPDFDLFKSLIDKSLEEFVIKDKFTSLIDIYYFLKNSKLKYRVSLDSIKSKVFSFKCKNSQVNCYQFT